MHSRRSQRGAAVIIFFLVVFLTTVSIFLARYSPNAPTFQRNEQTMQALAQAREMVIAHAAANGVAPGGLPFPDRNNDGNYDGSGDCPPTGFDPTQHLLGKWPHYQEQGCGGPVVAFGKPSMDGGGETLWYAVSRNLVRSASGNYPVINSEIASATGWLTVVDGQGAVLTNRAAVVIIAPGAAVPGQNRAGAAPAPTQYLEAATVGATTYTHFAIEAGDTGFISREVDGSFNDQLIFITIDELLAAVERRVVAEARQLLRNYRTACGQYPWAVPYSNPRTAPNFNSVAATLEGLLPVGTALPFNWGAGCAAAIAPPAWLTTHNWHHLGHYAVATAVVQAGGACTPGVDCITVNALAAPNDDKQAVVLLAGDALAGQNRVTGNLTDYFEDQNASQGDRRFTVQGAAPFNDRLEVVN